MSPKVSLDTEPLGEAEHGQDKDPLQGSEVAGRLRHTDACPSTATEYLAPAREPGTYLALTNSPSFFVHTFIGASTPLILV